MSNMRNTSKFDVDGIPPLQEAVPLGMQHLLAMIVGNMVPAILISGILGLSGPMSTMLRLDIQNVENLFQRPHLTIDCY